MARVPVVSRTMKTSVCTVLAVDTVAGECFNDIVEVPRTYADEEKLLKIVKEMYNKENKTVVKIVNVDVKEQLYAMPEADFLYYAKPVTKEETTNE